MYRLEITNPDKLFFTSDLHFDHFAIAKYCNRPFESRSDMNHKLVENWNSVIPEDGIVINCGDMILLHKENIFEYYKIAEKLNGRQLLIRGNHDKVNLLSANRFISPMDPKADKKFIGIYDIAEIKIKETTITASHYPLLAFPTDYNVFGHVHTLSDGHIYGPDSFVEKNIRTNQYDVGVDQNDYKPISYNRLIKIFNLLNKKNERI